MKVGFIGAGRMGRPMVARLVDAGHHVRTLGRTAEKRRELEQLGASAVDEVAEAGAQADVVVLCVFTDEQVRQVCLDNALLPTMPPGSALVVHTTTSPKTIEAIAARAHDIDVVDAPVSGGPHDIAAGKLTLFVGGAGQRVKLVNNALFAGHIGLLAESIRLGERLGVQESTLLAALAHGSATSQVLSLVATGGSVASFIKVAGEFVSKDVAVVRGIAEELGSDLGVLDDVINVINVAGKV